MPHVLAFLAVVAVLGLPGCKEGINNEFQVRVVTPSGDPVVRAVIEGGFDLTYFHVRTDSLGIANVPSSGWKSSAVIYKNNFFTFYVPLLLDSTYILDPTPDSLLSLGEVQGNPIRFDNGTLITVTYQGVYHVYTYSDTSVTDVFSEQLPATAIKDLKLLGDTLWLCTHDNGIYVFSIGDISAPELLLHIDIPGYLSHLEVMDSLLIVSFIESPIRIYVYRPDGTWSEVATLNIKTETVKALQNPYLGLVKTGKVVVFNLTNPQNPQQVWSLSDPSIYGGLFQGDTLLLLMANIWERQPPYPYKALDLSNPIQPVEIGNFECPEEIISLVNDSMAIGQILNEPFSIEILKGSLTSVFEPVAVVSERMWAPEDIVGCQYPYFVIDRTLWKLKD